MPDDSTALDEVERSILDRIQTDARNTTNAELSDAVDVSATTIGQRITDLEERGVILDYHAQIDYAQAGFPHHIMLCCTVDPAIRHETAADLVEEPGVVNVVELISGEENLLVEVVGRTRQEVVDAIIEIEGNGATVARTEMINDVWRQPFDDFGPD